MTELRDINDLTPGLGVFHVPVGSTGRTPEIEGVECLLDFWAQAVAEESAPGALALPSYDLVIEQQALGTAAGPVPFLTLSYGLQRVLGGSATDVLYAARADQALADEIERFAGSTWTRETVPARTLAPYVLNAWARAHLWPGIRPRSLSRAVQLVPVAYASLVRGALQAAPVILYCDALHEASVPYLLAILRFAPDAEVRVLRGCPPDGVTPRQRPFQRPWDWAASGAHLLDRDAPVSSAERAVQYDRRQFQVAAQRDGNFAGRLPYLLGAPPLAVQLVWRAARRPQRAAMREVGQYMMRWLPFAFAGAAERLRRASAVVAWAEAAARFDRHPLRNVLPEYGRALRVFGDRMGTPWYPSPTAAARLLVAALNQANTLADERIARLTALAKPAQ